MSDSPYKPLEGDPDLLTSKARHYQEIGDAIARSVITLRKIHDVDHMKSKAVDAVRGSADDVADDINKAKDRYQQTATALLHYATSLRSAQQDANAAIAEINEKQETATKAHTAAKTAQSDADSATDADKSDKTTAATQAQDHAEAADAALRQAQQKWHDALDEKNRAADAATKLIVEVVSGDKKHGLEDSWWDNWGSKILDIVKVICDIAGILSIFLAWVPILGQVLLVLAALGAIIKLVESIVAAVSGNGSWWAVLGAAGMAVLTIFGGKIFSLAAKQLKGAMIVSTGVKGSRALRELQGVSKGSKEFMSFKAAQKAMRKPLTSAFKNPFARSQSQYSIMGRFQSGELSIGGALKESAKEAFPAIKGDWKGALGVNSELLAASKLARNSSVVVTTPMRVKGVALSAFQIYTTEQKITGMGNDLIKHDLPALAGDGLKFGGGKYGDLVGSGTSVYKDGKSAYGDVFG